MMVRPVRVVPVEVVVRNLAAGSLCRQMPIAAGTPLEPPLLDLYYKDDSLGDPLLSEARLERLAVVTPAQLEAIRELAFAVNDGLRALFDQVGLELVDFKIELGFTAADELVVADEISPDTCRLWDLEVGDPRSGSWTRIASARILAAWWRPTGRSSNGSKGSVPNHGSTGKVSAICGLAALQTTSMVGVSLGRPHILRSVTPWAATASLPLLGALLLAGPPARRPKAPPAVRKGRVPRSGPRSTPTLPPDRGESGESAPIDPRGLQSNQPARGPAAEEEPQPGSPPRRTRSPRRTATPGPGGTPATSEDRPGIPS